MAVAARDAPQPPSLEHWCEKPAPSFPGKRIPRRKRAELVLAAALLADALPARDVRANPPAWSEEQRVAEGANRPEPEEKEEEPPDFSAEGIRRALLASWEYRPAGIRYARW